MLKQQYQWIKKHGWIVMWICLIFLGGAPLNIVCDNCKTAVISHPRWGDIELNEEYLTFCEYYGIIMKPANVRKPKEKASVEGVLVKLRLK